MNKEKFDKNKYFEIGASYKVFRTGDEDGDYVKSSNFELLDRDENFFYFRVIRYNRNQKKMESTPIVVAQNIRHADAFIKITEELENGEAYITN